MYRLSELFYKMEEDNQMGKPEEEH
jgi:hypothetical protein